MHSSRNGFTDPSKAVLPFWIIFWLFIFCVYIAALRSPAGKDLPLGSLVCEVLLCFCQFPMWCPGSDVVLECIDS